MRLCPLLLDHFPAVYHVCPSAGLLGLLPSLQRLDEVVGAVCADEASLWARESRGKVRGRRGENVGHKTDKPGKPWDSWTSYDREAQGREGGRSWEGEDPHFKHRGTCIACAGHLRLPVN